MTAMTNGMTPTSGSERWREAARNSILVRLTMRVEQTVQRLISPESSTFVQWLTPVSSTSDFPHVRAIATSSRVLAALEAVFTRVRVVGYKAATTRLWTALWSRRRALQPRERRQIIDCVLLSAIVTNLLLVSSSVLTTGPTVLLAPITFSILAIIVRIQVLSRVRRRQAGTAPE